MLGPIGSEVMRLFKLLSPDEIDRYIEFEKPRRAEGTMAAGGETLSFDEERPHLEDRVPKDQKFDSDQKAEIIPLSEHQEKKSAEKFLNESEKFNELYAEKEDATVHEMPKAQTKESSGGNDLSSLGILSASRIKEIEAERLKKENDKKDSATVFLLKERQKMRDSKKRLIEQTALKQYQINASQEFHEQSESDLLDEDSSHDLRGILINKTQY